MKVAISLPDPVFEAAEDLAQQLKVSRSQLYAQALAAYVGVRSARAVREKLDAVYATDTAEVDAALAKAQLRTLSHETW